MVKTFDHPALQVVCDPIVPDDDLSFLTKMKQACGAFPTGVGLAAPQIGVTKRAILIAEKKRPAYFMINPVIAHSSDEKEVMEEGCLSYPGFSGPVERAKSILVEYYNPDDTQLESLIARTIDDFEARIVLHEVDHLNGVCAVKNFWKQSLNVKL